jgi:hypothetical protein
MSGSPTWAEMQLEKERQRKLEEERRRKAEEERRRRGRVGENGVPWSR